MLKKILIPFRFIKNHPLTKDAPLKAFLRFVKWQISSLKSQKMIVFEWVNGLKLNVKKGMHGATGCIYVGLPEFDDMSFLLHFLNKQDQFLDIGANIGVYSLLASGINKCNTISFEPVPSTFKYLVDNIEINQLGNAIDAKNIGLSSKEDNLFFTKSQDTVNHVVEFESDDTVKVSVQALDQISIPQDIKDILIKLDVEGFELNVLNGAINLLADSRLKALIVELNGSGEKYGFKDSEVDKKLMENGFIRFDYNPFKRSLSSKDRFNKEGNTLYIRSSEVDYVTAKLIKANSFEVLNHRI